jgi:type I restriction enzyme S subunit
MNIHFEGFRRKGLVFIGNEEAAQLDHVTVQPYDVLFNITGASIGRVTTAPADMAGARVNQHVCILRTTDALVPQFLAYYMATPAQQAVVDSNQTGGTRQAVTKAMLLEWPVPLPAPKEQRRIVELLEQADRLRRQRTEADTLADRILPVLFRKMFGDPTTNPKGWPTTTLDHAAGIATGNTPSREDPENFGGGIPWGRPADLETALPLLHTAENISQKGARTARVVPAGSVLVCCIGATLGKVGLAGVEMAINQQINALLPSAKATPEFLYTFSLLNARNFMVAATQATLPILNKSRFGQQPVFLPPIERQVRFSELAQAVIKQRPAQSAARQNVENVFAAMLHRAFTGELTAKWREAHMKELLAEMEQQARLLKSPLEE